jgi:hypothetical protein
MLGVPWLYPTEINSLPMRTKGAAVATATDWYGSILQGINLPSVLTQKKGSQILSLLRLRQLVYKILAGSSVSGPISQYNFILNVY